MSFPKISVILFAYRHERFIAEAVRSMLDQDCPPIQIILSDDNSPDGTFEIMRRTVSGYTGPHRISLNRNAENLGIGAHVNRLMSLADGELIIAAAGDDISLPHRAATIASSWETLGRPTGSLVSGYVTMTEAGRDLGAVHAVPPAADSSLEHLVTIRCNGVPGCAHAWHRGVFETFGDLDSALVAEDKAVGFRSACLGGIHVIDTPLMRYRQHGAQVSRGPKSAFSVGDRARKVSRGLDNGLRTDRQILADLDHPVVTDKFGDGAVSRARNILRERIAGNERDLAGLGGGTISRITTLARRKLLGRRT
jgi:glycosyltransferase involved in cell wall biosynthesis